MFLTFYLVVHQNSLIAAGVLKAIQTAAEAHPNECEFFASETHDLLVEEESDDDEEDPVEIDGEGGTPLLDRHIGNHLVSIDPGGRN